MNKYIESTEKVGQEFYRKFVNHQGALVMLNLLKFKSKANYSNLIKDINGEQAYELYTKNTSEKLQELGSEILFYGKSNHFLIGPESEQWDAVLLVKHQSFKTFIAFSNSDIYLENVIHRTAALDDSRLLPISEFKNT